MTTLVTARDPRSHCSRSNWRWTFPWPLAADFVTRRLIINQRGPLEYTFFRPFPRLVFGCINADFCVQGRIFQRFSSSPFFLCTIPDFSDFSGPLHHFSQNLTQFSPNFKRDSRFCKSLSNFHRISSGFHRISVILIGVMSK